MNFYFNPAEEYYTFFRYENHKCVSEKYKIGSFILDYLDIDISYISNLFVNEYAKSFTYMDSYNDLINALSQKYNKRLIILIHEQASYIYSNYQLENKNIHLSNIINSMNQSLTGLQNDLKEFIQNNKIEKGNYVYMLEDLQNIKVSFFLDEESNDIFPEYEVHNIFSLILLDFFNLKSRNITIKYCQHCLNPFIPSKRSDEIYCDRIIYNHKTCKEIGYGEKVKNDPFKAAYTKARKTQHARIRYNSHIEDYKSKHYEPWKKAAEQAKKKFEKNNDITGFEKWLKDNKNTF